MDHLVRSSASVKVPHSGTKAPELPNLAIVILHLVRPTVSTCEELPLCPSFILRQIFEENGRTVSTPLSQLRLFRYVFRIAVRVVHNSLDTAVYGLENPDRKYKWKFRSARPGSPMSGVSPSRTARFLIVAAEPPRIFILFVLPTRVEAPHMSKFLRTTCCLVLLCAAWNAAFGQLSTATAFGNVTDASGAAIPNATVVFIQTQTNFTRTTTTNGQGEYHAEFLPVGSYTAKVDATGFKDVVQSGIVLSVTQQADAKFFASARRAKHHCQRHQPGSLDQPWKFRAGPYGGQSRN